MLFECTLTLVSILINIELKFLPGCYPTEWIDCFPEACISRDLVDADGGTSSYTLEDIDEL